MSHTIITGAQGGATQGALAPNRLEINDLIKNERQFSLYIQALSKPPPTPYRTLMGPLTFTQPSWLRHLRAIRYLIMVLPEYTASPTCRGRVLVATAPSKGHDGVGTALTETYFSRLGTGPMWPSTRLVSFHEILHK
jgi:hypothetical protein